MTSFIQPYPSFIITRALVMENSLEKEKRCGRYTIYMQESYKKRLATVGNTLDSTH